MGNQGAFITLNGKDMIPRFTSYEAVVRIFILYVTFIVVREFIEKFYDFFSATSKCKANGICKCSSEVHVLMSSVGSFADN